MKLHALLALAGLGLLVAGAAAVPHGPLASLLPGGNGAHDPHGALGGTAGVAGLEAPRGARGPVAASLPLVDDLTFASHTVGVGSTYWDLYEPAMSVAGDGTIYVSGHTAAADTLRSMAAFSRDDGKTWAKLPDVQGVTVPVIAEGVGQGDEGIIATDAAGHAWLYDSDWIAGPSFLYKWCGDGATLCHVDPLTYDTAQSVLGACGPRTIDKPWAMYGHGKLILVNNGPGLGIDPDTQLQLGLYDTATDTHVWNTCAGVGGRPGVPAIRDADGLFAAPQVQGPIAAPVMAVTYGTDLAALHVASAFPTFGDWVACNAFNGAGAFSAPGTYYVAGASHQGTLTVAATTDMEHYVTASLDLPGQLYYEWMTGSPRGEGALLSFAVAPLDDCNHPSFYAAHVALVGGQVEITDLSLVVAPQGYVCGHYSGNGVGPDGRAYLVVYADPVQGCSEVPQAPPGTHFPLRVYVQSGGPRL